MSKRKTQRDKWQTTAIAAAQTLRREWDVCIADGCRLVHPGLADAIEGMFPAVLEIAEYKPDAWEFIAAMTGLADAIQTASTMGVEEWRRHIDGPARLIRPVNAVLEACERLQTPPEPLTERTIVLETPEELERMNVGLAQQSWIYGFKGPHCVDNYKAARAAGTLAKSVTLPAARPRWQPEREPPIVGVLSTAARLRDAAAEQLATELAGDDDPDVYDPQAAQILE